MKPIVIIDKDRRGFYFNMDKVSMVGFEMDSGGRLIASVYMEGFTSPHQLIGESAEALLKHVTQ